MFRDRSLQHIDVVLAARRGDSVSKATAQLALEHAPIAALQELETPVGAMRALVEITLGEILEEALRTSGQLPEVSVVNKFKIKDKLITAATYLSMTATGKDRAEYDLKALDCIIEALSISEHGRFENGIDRKALDRAYLALSNLLIDRSDLWTDFTRLRRLDVKIWKDAVCGVLSAAINNNRRDPEIRNNCLLYTLTAAESPEARAYAHALQQICSMPYKIHNLGQLLCSNLRASDWLLYPGAAPLLVAPLLGPYLDARDRILGVNLEHGRNAVGGDIDLLLWIDKKSKGIFKPGLHVLEIKLISDKNSLLDATSMKTEDAYQQLIRAKHAVSRQVKAKAKVHAGIVLVDKINGQKILSINQYKEVEIYRIHLPTAPGVRQLKRSEMLDIIQQRPGSLNKILAEVVGTLD